MKRKMLATLVLGLSALSFDIAMAHGGAKPKHGGVVATASDLGFELVSTATVRQSISRTTAKQSHLRASPAS